GLEAAGGRPDLLRPAEHPAAPAGGGGGLRPEGGGGHLAAGGQRQGLPRVEADAAAPGVHPAAGRGEGGDSPADLARPARYEAGGDGGRDAAEGEGAGVRG